MAIKRKHQAVTVVAPSSRKVRKTDKLTSKILKVAYEQQRELVDEEIAKTIPMSSFFKEAVNGLEDFIDDDEQSQEFQTQLDYQDMTSTEEEDNLFDALFSQDGASIAKRLSNAITCIKKREDKASVAEKTTSMPMPMPEDKDDAKICFLITYFSYLFRVEASASVPTSMSMSEVSDR
ncbi:PREDICTED: uncharacterized protein LOC104714151, partial [Camelina sativa]|uniref:Uncharacterized protein LOC104714151 n=1 Tax=Camelina sativa TaxID=90675 RepID=A0ABM1QEC5_CAMSA